MPFRQEDIQYRGHAIECRINAEDPARGFLPCPGLIERSSAPNGQACRVDTHLYVGYRVPSHYGTRVAAAREPVVGRRLVTTSNAFPRRTP